jgi:Na+/glutamate symporter
MTEMSPTPKKTNGMAITGFVLSFFCGILGIVFSAIGLSQTGKNPNQGGRGLAIAGLIISIVSLVISFIWWGSLSSAMNNA